ncbi:hypothetical protein BJ170DRAFT_677196 [Xylariales sp. AK1849]|nr:hypothetical protein BJ170DRAFT_677196 [Xylariales sp. AK1849]
MDPLGALSVAAAVVQFAEFGYNFVKGTRDIYKSSTGRAREHIELSVVSGDLLKDGWPDGVGPDYLKRLCRERKETRDDLEVILGKLQARGTSRISLATSSLFAALRSVSAAGEIEKLTERLSQIRQQAMMAVLTLLLGAAMRNGVELRQFAQQQADIIATLEGIDQTTKQFSTGVMEFIDMRSDKNRSKATELVRYVMSDKWNVDKYVKDMQMDTHTTLMIEEYTKKIVPLLFYEQMNYRQDAIPQNDSREIYWITGKPGAGKSTLMKFISRDSRFEQSLHWANGAELLVVHYFSWTAGNDKLQKSHEGLIRTLLFETLSQHEALLAPLFPARCFLLQVFADQAVIPQLSLYELMTAFRALLSVTGETLKLVRVIDGLDEFDGNLSQLVELLREANMKDGVKICTSSRPWNVFKDEYHRSPKLQLENLTQDDIALFVREKFRCSRGFQELEETNPTMAWQITKDIVEKAQSVFLWVSVVSGLLETSFQEGYSMVDLQQTIDGLPSQVSELFQFIWNRTSPRFREEASRYFQIIHACDVVQVIPHAITIWLGDEEVPIDLEYSQMKNLYWENAISFLERRLTSRTGGLLEISRGQWNHPRNLSVGFMHRTAMDWVSDNWDSIASSTKVNFDPTLWILKGKVIQTRVELFDPHWTDIQKIISIASKVKDLPSNVITLVKLLDRPDQFMTFVQLGYAHIGLIRNIADPDIPMGFWTSCW